MRKLVKKLALVLALVLAIGCIAPASAQAAEGVRRSWNFAPGEYKPTLNLTVDQSYTLEALDYEAAMNYSIYDVAYYSYNTDALTVSKETGYAVANAAAENVKIKAVVLNKETGNTASFWGFVDIAEKEVVATATPTEVPATPTPTAVPTVAPFEIVSSEQISLNTYVVYFNQPAEVTSVAVERATKEGSAPAKDYYSSVVFATDMKSATIKLYNNMVDGNVITTTVGDTKYSFTATVGAVDKVVIETEVVPVSKLSEIKVKLYNAAGVDITTKDKVSKNVILEQKSGDSSSISGSGIIFWEADKTASVVATYHTWEYDDNGNEKGVVPSAAAVITSSEVSDVLVVQATTVIEKGNAEDADWDELKNYIPMKVKNAKIVAKIVKYSGVNGELETVYSDELEKIKFESSDPSKLLVAADGTLYPVAEGVVDVALYYKDTVIGVFTTTVSGEKKAQGVTAVANKNIVSNSKLVDDKIVITTTVKDQYGTKIDSTPQEVKYITVPVLEDGSEPIKPIVTRSNNKVTISAKGATEGTYVIEIKQSDKKTTVAFQVRTPGEEILRYTIESDVAEVDLNVEASEDALKTYVANIKAYSVGLYNCKINPVNFVGELPSSVTISTKEGLYYSIAHANSKNKALVDMTADGSNLELDFLTTNGEVEAAAAAAKAEKGETYEKDNVDDNTIVKKGTGTYKITLYEVVHEDGAAYKKTFGTVSIVVKDTQKKFSASLDTITSDVKYADCVSGGAFISNVNDLFNDAIKDCFTFKYDGAEIENQDNVGVFDLDSPSVTKALGSKDIYVEKATYTENILIGGTTYKLVHGINLKRVIKLQ